MLVLEVPIVHWLQCDDLIAMALQILSHFSRAGTKTENSFWSEIFLDIRDESIRLVFPELRLGGFPLRLVMMFFKYLVGQIVGEISKQLGPCEKCARVIYWFRNGMVIE